MSLRVDSELVYKNLSKTKRDKNSAARCERRANKVQVYTTRKRFKFSNICGNPNESVSEGEAARMDLGRLGYVKGGKLS